MRYQCIHSLVGQFSMAAFCRVMQVSRSGYYAWSRRVPGKRDEQNETLLGRVRRFFERSKGT